MKVVHYGKPFFRERFSRITNTTTPKPTGGFWTSPIDAKFGWKEWVEDEDMQDFYDISEKHIIEIDDNAKICVIDSLEKAKKLLKYGENPVPNKKGIEVLSSWIMLNWEAIAVKYDAILFSLSSDGRLYSALYTWDCDTVLIANPNIIVNI